MYCCTVFKLDGSRDKFYGPSADQLEGLLPPQTELKAWRIVNTLDGVMAAYWTDGSWKESSL